MPSTYYLGGPTGAGKSAFAVDLAVRIGAEIVGADAFQVYAGLPILTAQPTPAQRSAARHHLVGAVPLAEAFDAHRYVREARAAIRAIHERNRPALVVGGTGLYFRALIEGLAPTPPPDSVLRAEMAGMETPALVDRLRRLDASALEIVDLRNRRRIERAIEIVAGSGRPLSDFRGTPRREAAGILVMRERTELVRRIAENARAMFGGGVVEEVAAAREIAGPTARRAIGFSEIADLLDGRLGRTACEEAVVVATRRYAKRQLTWFRNQTTFRPLELSPSTPNAIDRALKLLAQA